VQLSAYAALVGRDATYRHTNITLGGSVVRLRRQIQGASPVSQ